MAVNDTVYKKSKWQQMALFTKIRIWDDATSYKRSMKNGVICAKISEKWRDLCSLQKPDFPESLQ
jgi:hypothetical protein